MRWGPVLVAAPVVAATLALGQWQLGRHAERNAPRDAAAAVAALPPLTSVVGVADPTWRRVSLRGKREGAPQLESGLVEADTPGYRRYDRLVTADGDVWLVEGAFVPHEGLGAALAAPLPEGVEGQVRPTGGPPAEPLAEREGATIWAPGTTAAMAAHVGARGLLVDTRLHPLPAVPEPDPTSLHYAWQWFAIAAIAAAFGGIGALRPPQASPPPRRARR